MGLISTAWALAQAAGNRVVVQNANKVLSATGLDNLAARWFGRKPTPTPALTITLYTSGFLRPFPPSNTVTNLSLGIKANETVSIARITVLFNRTGGNGSYELASYAQPRLMHQGEDIAINVLHYRKEFASFWDEEHSSTHPLKDIDNSLWDEHTKRLIHFDGPYYCEIVVMHNKGEARKRFTILNPGQSEKPSIVDPSDHQDYDPNRHIPARGMFWH